jgi:hypothetical protein
LEVDAIVTEVLHGSGEIVAVRLDAGDRLGSPVECDELEPAEPASDIEDATPLEIAAVNEAASERSAPVEVARGALGDEVAHGFDDYNLSHAALEAR